MSLFNKRLDSYDSQVLQTLENQVNVLFSVLGESPNEMHKLAKKFLDQSIRLSEKNGYRHKTNLGDERIKDVTWLNKRIAEGLTAEDCKDFWNRAHEVILGEFIINDVWRRGRANAYKLTGMSWEDAVKRVQKDHIIYGEPDQIEGGFIGDSRYIYPEFAKRFEHWRSTVTTEQEVELSQKYETYNAMVRDLIIKNKI